ncbi:amino acid permease [Aneurinibacillus sp. Ricciae_BoGa-3]|uniref:amino acid permease n=1 Tax=Aneurinibacillus sp. Ricciae_BoGa-3 TaxID=3022697 RepID=UPI00233FFE5E|nr:amino acid permease [Aneurinibacillus sp. Ricciae_BoGa-3]WCK55604.1 amino acid permease [Aneurinibacillus sp. Ricciae_BoGa-3]
MADKKLGFWVLTALVVGNMVGSGIFMLPRSLAEVASPAGVLLAWGLTGLGVLLTVLVFGNLALRKPNITGGPQMYAKELFSPGSEKGILTGYLVSWGYWVANWAGNVAIVTTFASYLSTFFPVMTSKAPLWKIAGVNIAVGNAVTFVVCSVLLWGIHVLILRGIEGAGKINFIATTAKVLGFIFFIVITLFAFQKSYMLPLYAPKTDSGLQVGLFGQVNHAAIATLWAFVGVESSVVFSSRAKRQRDVKTSTILGLILALIIYVGITLLVMGALPQQKLITAEKPLVDALSAVVGSKGSYIMAALGIICLAGTSIGWIMLSSEVPYQAAKQGIFPPLFLKQNKNGAPIRALTLTNIMSQLFIFSTISQTMAQAYGFLIFIATLSYLVPYIISSVYQLKLAITGETYEGQRRNRTIDLLIASLATIYSLWVIIAGTSDIKTFSLGIALLAAGLIFYPSVRKNRLSKNQDSVPDKVGKSA